MSDLYKTLAENLGEKLKLIAQPGEKKSTPQDYETEKIFAAPTSSPI